MTLKVIGAGLGRTGTTSLLVALRKLLNKPCYHMSEVFDNEGHPDIWKEAIQGELPDWKEFYKNYSASVDWPSAAFWSELSRVFPDALILLSERDSESWWNSANETIFRLENIPDVDNKKRSMIESLFSNKLTPDYRDKAKAIKAYEKHNAFVKMTAPEDRLLIWNAEQGWAPICNALNLPVPDEPFPKVNTRQHWQERVNSVKEEEGCFISKANIDIGSAEKYLNRLCKHFNHKVDASYGEGKGIVDFKFATCNMLAEGSELKLVCQASSADKLMRVKYVLEDHLIRFTQKEKIKLIIEWD